MNKKDTFISIAELAFAKEPAAKLATAVEMVGFYTWDKFGRYIHIPPGEEIYEDLRVRVMDDLAKGCTSEEDNVDYFYEQMMSQGQLQVCGWVESKLPDFEKLQSEWNMKYAGMTETPKHSEPAAQGKVWDVVEGLVNLKYGSAIVNSGVIMYH